MGYYDDDSDGGYGGASRSYGGANSSYNRPTSYQSTSSILKKPSQRNVTLVWS